MAAAAVGVSLRTCRRRMAEVGFAERVRRARQALLSAGLGRLSRLTAKAARTRGKLLAADQPPPVRRAAAASILAEAARFHEATDLADRMAEIERRLNERDGRQNGHPGAAGTGGGQNGVAEQRHPT